MSKKIKSSTHSGVFIESLEQRTMLSAAVSHTTLKLSKTKTAIGQDVTLTMTVKGTKSAPVDGSVELFIDGADVGGLTLTSGKASYTFGPGNFGLFTGKHSFQGQYAGNSTSTLAASASKTIFETVTAPKVTTTASGLKYAIVKKGTGKTVSSTGQTANVLYTGFLVSDGTIFDFSAQHPPLTPLPVTIGDHGVVPGFEEGVTGMKLGEERMLYLPSALAYGANGSGSIPANADLIFIVRLVSLT